MKILYINYIDTNSVTSGSNVRPVKIMNALKNSGNDVEVLTGVFSKNDHSERKSNVISLIKRIKDGERFDLCYIESISGLLYKYYNKYEIDLLKTIKKAEIPMGIFYRDIFWKFAKLFGLVSHRRKIENFLCKKELKRYCKLMDVIFVPSMEMAEHMPKGNYCALPPGCDEIDVNRVCGNAVPTFIYVGGTSYQYGADIMLEAFKKVNESIPVKLNLVCRPDETEIIDDFMRRNIDTDWLNVIHASGSELDKYYDDSDYAIFSGRRSKYFDFAMPVKIFEYISHEKPIVSTDCKALEFIGNNGLGYIVNDNSDSLSEGILRMIDTGAEKFVPDIRVYKKNNTWAKRAEKIQRELLAGNI